MTMPATTALEDAERILGYQPMTHLSGPEWRSLVERLVAERAVVERRSPGDRRQSLPKPGKSIVDRAGGDRRVARA